MSSIELGSLMNLSSSLTSLSLKFCELQGKFPNDIFRLPNLQILQLGSNYDLTILFPKGNWSSPLEILDLSSTSFSGELPNSIGNLQSLNYLDLSSTNLSGELPDSIGNLQSLNYLDLYYCKFSGPVPASLGNLTQITHLNLRLNQFIGEIPSSLSNLGQLTDLYLSDNNFNRFSFSIVNMTQLVSLDLSHNQLMGSIPSQEPVPKQRASPIPSQLLPNLKSLDLSYNLLNGTIPYWVFTLPLLVHLDLSHNHLTGQIHEFQYNSLEDVVLNNNELHGTFPTSIFQLMNLTSLILSSNKYSVIVEEDKFTKLKSLQELDLSGNSLSWATNNNVNFTLPILSILKLSSCNLSEFPNFLKTLENLEELDLSNNKIHGEIPNWVWDMGKYSFYYLNLSSNFLTSEVKLPWNNLQILDLHSNMLQGPLPFPLQPSSMVCLNTIPGLPFAHPSVFNFTQPTGGSCRGSTKEFHNTSSYAINGIS